MSNDKQDMAAHNERVNDARDRFVAVSRQAQIRVAVGNQEHFDLFCQALIDAAGAFDDAYRERLLAFIMNTQALSREEAEAALKHAPARLSAVQQVTALLDGQREYLFATGRSMGMTVEEANVWARGIVGGGAVEG